MPAALGEVRMLRVIISFWLAIVLIGCGGQPVLVENDVQPCPPYPPKLECVTKMPPKPETAREAMKMYKKLEANKAACVRMQKKIYEDWLECREL